MSPQRLALRTLMLRQPRSMMAIVLIAACLCLLELVAGTFAGERTRLAYQAVIGERLGHLSITPAAEASAQGFTPPQAQRIQQLAETVPGVALVQPRMRVRGIAANGARSALFDGEGVGAADLIFASLAGIAFAVIGAAIAATVSINGFERRREVATLRALGMGRRDVFLMVTFEALWMALFAVMISLMGSGLIAWLVNRVALSLTTRQAGIGAPMLVELDFDRMAVAVLVVMAVALLAALAPAWKAARADVAAGLAA